MSDWHRRRVQAAALALAPAGAAADEQTLRQAEAAVGAADRAVGGVVPHEEFEQLALDHSAWMVRARQTDDLLRRALETLDQIAAGPDEDAVSELRGLAFGTAVELRAVLGAQREAGDEQFE